VKLDFLLFACPDFLTCACEKEISGFDMHKLFKPCMRKENFRIWHAQAFSSRTCEKRFSGFHMHRLFKPYMRKGDFRISHAQAFQAVHVKRRFLDFTCTSFSSRTCEKEISGFGMHACSERTAENLYFTSYRVLGNGDTMAENRWTRKKRKTEIHVSA